MNRPTRLLPVPPYGGGLDNLLFDIESSTLFPNPVTLPVKKNQNLEPEYPVALPQPEKLYEPAPERESSLMACPVQSLLPLK